MTIAQLQALELEHEAATVQRFEKLRELAPAMKDGDETAEAAWLAEAEKLVESFREVKPLFPSTRAGTFLKINYMSSNPFDRLNFVGCPSGEKAAENRKLSKKGRNKIWRRVFSLKLVRHN